MLTCAPPHPPFTCHLSPARGWPSPLLPCLPDPVFTLLINVSSYLSLRLTTFLSTQEHVTCLHLPAFFPALSPFFLFLPCPFIFFLPPLFFPFCISVFFHIFISLCRPILIFSFLSSSCFLPSTASHSFPSPSC